jgi:hypothetical protein
VLYRQDLQRGSRFGERAAERLKNAGSKPHAVAPSSGRIGSRLNTIVLKLKKPKIAKMAFTA